MPLGACFAAFGLHLLTKALGGVHFFGKVGFQSLNCVKIGFYAKKPEPLSSDRDFVPVVENECDTLVSVNDGFFDHHCPDGVVPFMKNRRAFPERPDAQLVFSGNLTKYIKESPEHRLEN